jgi:hypothetical protein
MKAIFFVTSIFFDLLHLQLVFLHFHLLSVDNICQIVFNLHLFFFKHLVFFPLLPSSPRQPFLDLLIEATCPRTRSDNGGPRIFT